MSDSTANISKRLQIVKCATGSASGTLRSPAREGSCSPLAIERTASKGWCCPFFPAHECQNLRRKLRQDKVFQQSQTISNFFLRIAGISTRFCRRFSIDTNEAPAWTTMLASLDVAGTANDLGAVVCKWGRAVAADHLLFSIDCPLPKLAGIARR